MIYDYLKRGVAAGLLAGLAYGLYIALVANPLLGYVHDLGEDEGHGSEGGHSHGAEAGHGHSDGAAHGHEHAETVSEATGAIVSVGGGVLWAVLLAGAFAVAYYVFEPALPGTGAAKAAVLGAAGFFSVSVVPWLVLPPMAPGAEATVGIDARLAIYAGLIGLGLLASATAIVGYRRVAPRGRFRALAAALAPIGIVVGALAALSPSIVVQPAVADELVFAVRGAAAVSQAGLWASIAVAFAWLHGRTGSRSVIGRAGVADENAVPVR